VYIEGSIIRTLYPRIRNVAGKSNVLLIYDSEFYFKFIRLSNLYTTGLSGHELMIRKARCETAQDREPHRCLIPDIRICVSDEK